MRLTQIEVECYAGAKADETPRRFNLEGQNIEVNEVLDRWYQVESKPEWPRAYYFRFEPWTNANTFSNMISSPTNGFWGSNGEDWECFERI